MKVSVAGNGVEAVQGYSLDITAISSPTKSLSRAAEQSQAVLSAFKSTPTALIFSSFLEMEACTGGLALSGMMY